MRREIMLITLYLLTAVPVISQEADHIKYISELLAKDPEDLSEDEIQLYEDVLNKPLILNLSSAFEIHESGLFSRYQVASILDYRKRSGQILSLMELSALDGFSQDFIVRLRPFISLEYAPELDGWASNELTGRTSLRASSDVVRYGYATRYKLKYGERLSLSLASSRSLDALNAIPDAVSGSACMRFRKVPVKLIAGNYNIRFGQGLALWTGADFSSLNSPSSFIRRPSGITPSSSFTGNGLLTGAAAELNYRRLSLSVYLGMSGLKQMKSKPEKTGVQSGCNVMWLWKHGQVGLTHFVEIKGLTKALRIHIPQMKTSADFSACFKGIDVFFELMYDWGKTRPSALAGVVAPICDIGNIAAKISSSDGEHMLAVSSGLNTRRRLSGNLSANIIIYSEPKSDTQDRSLQFKIHTQWEYKFSESLLARLRVTERIRSWGEPCRTDIRTDISWNTSPFSASLRINMLNCIGTSFLSYIEGGYKKGKIAAYFRQGVFHVDNWDDRIYAYERDVPGCYNSPAFYGRGVWTSFYTSWNQSRLCRLYFRAGYTAYPFMKEKKPGKAELRLQTVFSF